jgi:hypothetical protein
MLVFRMDRQVKRVITPVGAAQAETVRRDYQLPPIEFECRAMWDTGSTGCCIDRCFAKELGLREYGDMKLHGPLGDGVATAYLLDITFQDGMTVHDVPVAAVDTGGAFEIVIGMDIINRGDFRLRLVDDKTVMTFNLLQEDTPQQKR